MLALSRLTMRGALASPLFAVALLGLGAAVALAPRLVFFGFGEDVRIVREAGFSALRLAGLIFAIAFAVPGERDRALEASLLARPITPATLVIGRFFGALAATVMALTMLSAVHYGTLNLAFDAASGAAPAEGFAPAAGRAALEASGLVALAVALGTVLQRGAAALGVLVIFALAHANRGLAILLPTEDGALAGGLAAAGYVALGAAVAEAREAGA